MKNLLASLLSKRIFCIKNLSEKMVKLQMAAGYVKMIKVFRKIQVSLFAMLFCMIFFISGITIIHITILFFAPWTEITRIIPVSYTHLRAHETRHDLVCRLLLEKKNNY